MQALLDKVAVVTGGASGIGLASARAFAAAGARVVVGDLDADRAAAAVADLGDAVRTVQVDVRDPEQIQRLADTALTHFGAIDAWHNNAGIAGDPAELHELGEDEFDRVLDVNLRGTWHGLKCVVPHMREQGSGAVVNTASVAGEVGFRRLAAYCASKAAIIALTRVAALENGPLSIRVNAVCPGLIDTPLTGDTDTPGGPFPAMRTGTAQEVADAVVWLCSDAAAYVNGTCLTIDGGWTATAGPRRA